MNNDFTQYLEPTTMVDFNHPTIQKLIEEKGWRTLSPFNAIKSIYNFVRDDITFGYNLDDTLPASQVLKDGYGQCNTKGTLLMALLRGAGVHARFHGFTIYNQLQKGAIPNYIFPIAPERIIHSWVEVWFDNQWLEVEGYIIDKPYLSQVQTRFKDQCDEFSAYGIATPCLKNPAIEWNGNNTYIQKEGIADDFGVYTHPDTFYAEYGSNLSGIKRVLFRYVLRHLMNRNVNRIRTQGLRTNLGLFAQR
ncbi:putative Transglutaminase-like enzyme, putative cysteine protease [Vibrio nigripulchritudo SFn27]|uniref:Putative Transglutaminase-like enzyme, putative cysteine protease n=1 Tax=Vibrio nigripulchritudo TaxID=28173 RepID=U4KB48_9VIBR|nr:transglutaminase family protein [Vibrio nigripulchritudo]CCN80552.1 putative Transglutaminase-like enzyme, putative cysteine protease [Vibrio nigripulchritudo BLFn1]CCN90635.1 putative Transglutaminase-like enzyme, putative cysteine protease [Vibrio nigripulchritudo SFn27]CCN93428.1 putative Transglutaminase-like enzyme, putative cysteine protease [Vibrio nigripulchritudo ENn2]CCO41909.1 putative Transglutaminase-like enzyme, putative cysteine protease [Vibrio nigripulchritudo SFn135]CCO519